MNQLIKTFILVISLSIVLAIFPKQILAQHNYQVFYNDLSPYGQWIENPDYGYVWIPAVGPDFSPYSSNGYWVMTDYGWTWVSDYDWGWATFHYGRWDYNDYYGWYWVPDNEWGPSWVTWRRSEGYYGWTPMRPGISISISFGGNYEVPNDRWIFVRDRDIERHDISRNYIDRSNNITIINNSTVINKTYYDNKRQTTYVSGPDRMDVQKIIGRTIKPIQVQERNKPGQNLNNDRLQIYRPQVQKNKPGQKIVPSEITNIKDVKRISERETKKQPRDLQQVESKTVKEQQPVVNPVNKINKKEIPSQKRNVNSPKNNVNKEQQPVVNPTNRINTKEIPSQKRNINPPKNNVNKEQQPVVNPTNRINTKEIPSQRRNTTPPNNSINKNNPTQQQKLDSPRKENKTVKPLPPQKINTPKNNNVSDKPQKERTITPQKNKSVDQPSKSNPNENKKENRKPK